MKSSLKLFMNGLIDYAGQFPPAALDLPSALVNFQGYCERSPYGTFLGRYVLSSAQVPELVALLPPHKKIDLCVLVSVIEKPGDFVDHLNAELAQLKNLLTLHKNKISVGAVEIKLPPHWLATFSGEQWSHFFTQFKQQAFEFSQAAFFWEPASLPYILDSAALLHWECYLKALHQAGFVGGHKIRTGGVKADAFPSVEYLAQVIKLCVQNTVAFKATAGLHHPIRVYHPSVLTEMHGFVNVFSAALYADQVALPALQEILSSTRPQDFCFADGYLQFKNWERISNEQIAQYRSQRAIAFGSCSFEEPVEDLTTLGWLE